MVPQLRVVVSAVIVLGWVEAGACMVLQLRFVLSTTCCVIILPRCVKAGVCMVPQIGTAGSYRTYCSLSRPEGDSCGWVQVDGGSQVHCWGRAADHEG